MYQLIVPTILAATALYASGIITRRELHKNDPELLSAGNVDPNKSTGKRKGVVVRSYIRYN